MKVLMINSVCGVGSTGRICTDIADMLLLQGHECKIAYGRGEVPEKYRDISVRIGSTFKVYCNVLKSRLFDNEGFNAVGATKKLVRWIKEYDPDVIHLHNIHGYYLNVKILFDYLKTSGKKVIWTLHDCWAFTGHCTHFQVPHCDKWRTECEKCIRVKDYPKALISHAKRNYKRKKQTFCGVPNLTIVTPSKWLSGLVEQSFLSEYQTVVINNGIDLSVFKPTESDFRERFGLTDKKIILGVASVWEKRKGFNDFLELAKLIDDSYRIVLVGVNDKQLKMLPSSVIGIKRTNNVKELAEIYTAADVLFNPTYEDNYPTVNLEAQACGTPVITYPTGGSVESVPSENVVNSVNEFYELLRSSKELVIAKTSFSKQEKYSDYLNLYIPEFCL